MVTTNRSTLHTECNIQQSVTQGSNDTTHRLSRRTTATTRFSPEGIGCQKQTTPRFCQHPISWAFTSQVFTGWRHLSTHPINRPATQASVLSWFLMNNTCVSCFQNVLRWRLNEYNNGLFDLVVKA